MLDNIPNIGIIKIYYIGIIYKNINLIKILFYVKMIFVLKWRKINRSNIGRTSIPSRLQFARLTFLSNFTSILPMIGARMAKTEGTT